jgi:AcrR family transcriptional regulator
MNPARQQTAVDSNSGVSPHAIAGQLGMAAPALYRYFRSRDDLVAALIESGHSALGLALSTAVAACSTCDYAGQALARAP